MDREAKFAAEQKAQAEAQGQSPWASRNTGKTYTVIGMLQELRIIRNKKGEDMAFAKLQDYNGTIELAFYAKTWGILRQQIIDGGVYAFKGKISLYKDNVSFAVDSVEDMSTLQVHITKEIHVQLENQLKNELEIQKLKDFLFGTSGNCSVYFHIDTNSGSYTIKANTQMTAPCDPDFIQKLKDVPFVKDVWTA